MAKSYVPRMLFLAKMFNMYITRHQTTIFKYVTDETHQQAITDCNNCAAHLLSLLSRAPEQP